MFTSPTRIDDCKAATSRGTALEHRQGFVDNKTVSTGRGVKLTSRKILLNGSFAPSLINFRGALIRDCIIAGHDVHVSAPAIGAAMRSQLRRLGAVVHQLPLDRAGTNPLADWRYFSAMKRLIGQIQPDLVINYTIKPNIWGSLAAAACQVESASMITGLGYAFNQRETLYQRVLGSITQALYRRSTGVNSTVIFQNPDDRDTMLAIGSLRDRGKARMVNGSGVDIVHFAPAPLPQKTVFLMAARLLTTKGVREYAEAAMAVMREREDVRFVLAGDCDSSPFTIRAQEVANWQAAGIEWLGWVEDIRPALREASVFVLPSYGEGTPRSVLEAMAMGRPIITSDAPGCRETVRDGDNGFLVPPRNAAALAQAMEKLVSDADLQARMGQRSRAICEEKYAVNSVNRSLMDHLGL